MDAWPDRRRNAWKRLKPKLDAEIQSEFMKACEEKGFTAKEASKAYNQYLEHWEPSS